MEFNKETALQALESLQILTESKGQDGPKEIHVLYRQICGADMLVGKLLPYKEELLKIAAAVGDPNDPFGAWESIEPLLKDSDIGIPIQANLAARVEEQTRIINQQDHLLEIYDFFVRHHWKILAVILGSNMISAVIFAVIAR